MLKNGGMDKCLIRNFQSVGQLHLKQKLASKWFIVCYLSLNMLGKDACMPNPCQHDGTCLQAHNNRGYHCLCKAGWRGYACERKCENIMSLSVSGEILLGEMTTF